MKILRVALISLLGAVIFLLISACNGPTTPSQTAPVVRSISVSPSGIGLENATRFSFSLDTNASPSQSTFVWDFGDGNLATGGPTATHVFTRSGSFVVKVTITNAFGQVTTLTTVRVASMIGSWFISIFNHTSYYRVPLSWIKLRFNQSLPSEDDISAYYSRAEGVSASWRDSAGCRAGTGTRYPIFAWVDDPRYVGFGVESFWCNEDGDFYLGGTADEEIRVITGTCTAAGYGGPACRFTMTRQ